MRLPRWQRVACLALVASASASAQGCELHASRSFVPPALLRSGPTNPPIAEPADQQPEKDEAERPFVPEWNEGVDERVVARRLENGIPLEVVARTDIPVATVLIVLGRKSIPAPSPAAEVYVQAAMRARDLPWSRRPIGGARLFTIAREDFVAMGVTALAPVLEGLLSRLLPTMLEAGLSGDDVLPAKTDLLATATANEPNRVGYSTALAGLFPIPHPYGWAGTVPLPGRVRDVTPAEVRAFRDANLAADNMLVAAAGDVNVASLAVTLEKALAGVPRTSNALVAPPGSQPSCAGVIAIDAAGSQQTNLTLSYPGVPAKHPDAAALQVLAAAAGGSFSTHLNDSLRRGQALSWGFGAALRTMRQGGAFLVQGDVDRARTVQALQTLNEELALLGRTPLGDDELLFAKIRAAHATTRLGGAATAVRLARASILGVSMSDVSAIKAVTAEQVRAAAERYLQPTKRCTVAVGDAARLRRELEDAGLGPVSQLPYLWSR